MNEREAALRAKLGIPEQYTSVLILEQSAHCDWDWLGTHANYYSPGADKHQAVQKTLEQAINYITNYIGDPAGKRYNYVFCEVGYLQNFFDDKTIDPSYRQHLIDYAGKHFFFASGGITSADNILVHPEAFIRNYLTGRQWLKKFLGVSSGTGGVSNQMWIPDDFGHDAQLPALLQAMGFIGAGFWRIPAQCGVYSNNCGNADATSSAPSDYLPLQVGLDYIWEASDGSHVQAHWLSNGYGQGNALGSGSTIDSDWQTTIEGFITQSQTTARPNPRYMFVPIDNDFCIPYNDGPTIFESWNQLTGQTTFALQATFDDYMHLVAAAAEDDPLKVLKAHPHPHDPIPPYIPNPYYSGFYASMPRIKNTHYAAVRTLLLAEPLQLFLRWLDPGKGEEAAAIIDAAWELLSPSTHHDYITGTSPNGPPCGADVYGDEQIPRLDEALTEAIRARDHVFDGLASSANGDAPSPAVMVFNGIGIARRGVAHLATPPAGTFQSTTPDGVHFYPVDPQDDGSLLILADVLPLGFSTVQLSANRPTEKPPILATNNNGVVTMTNGIITAEITGAGITKLYRGAGPNCLTGTGNALRLFTDQGNIYRFAMEIPCPGTQKFYWQQDVTFQVTSTQVTSANLYARTVVEGTFNGEPFTIRYTLYAGDDALRISVTGAAKAENICVMAFFEFASTAQSLTFGTTAHWDNESPRNFFKWIPGNNIEIMTFEATHEYVAAINGNGAIAGAIYHEATPPWGIYQGGVLGCLLRNTPTKNQNAACASDTAQHTVTYAVSPPDGLRPPQEGARTEGALLAEALKINNALHARTVTARGGLPKNGFAADPIDDRAIITAAKAGTVDPSQMILRFYQPTNAEMPQTRVTISSALAPSYSAGGKLIASAADALEQPSGQNLNITTGPTDVKLDLPFAITTVALGRGN